MHFGNGNADGLCGKGCKFLSFFHFFFCPFVNLHLLVSMMIMMMFMTNVHFTLSSEDISRAYFVFDQRSQTNKWRLFFFDWFFFFENDQFSLWVLSLYFEQMSPFTKQFLDKNWKENVNIGCCCCCCGYLRISLKARSSLHANLRVLFKRLHNTSF